MNVIFATKNEGKIKEVCEIMQGCGFNILSMGEAGINIDIVEDGSTFVENAVKKAVGICKVCNEIVLADDSGLEIDYLGKAPGVYSARYLGEGTPYSEKNSHILNLLKDVPEDLRGARFVCVIAAAFPGSGEPEAQTVTATLEGVISREIKGNNGFGYDPVLYIPGYNMTVAEMPAELKNSLSHRSKALLQIKGIVANHIKNTYM